MTGALVFSRRRSNTFVTCMRLHFALAAVSAGSLGLEHARCSVLCDVFAFCILHFAFFRRCRAWEQEQEQEQEQYENFAKNMQNYRFFWYFSQNFRKIIEFFHKNSIILRKFCEKYAMGITKHWGGGGGEPCDKA